LDGSVQGGGVIVTISGLVAVDSMYEKSVSVAVYTKLEGVRVTVWTPVSVSVNTVKLKAPAEMVSTIVTSLLTVTVPPVYRMVPVTVLTEPMISDVLTGHIVTVSLPLYEDDEFQYAIHWL
jgi:hypothetical protein